MQLYCMSIATGAVSGLISCDFDIVQRIFAFCFLSACIVLSPLTPSVLFDFQKWHLSNNTSFFQLLLIESHIPHMVLNVVQVRFIIRFACIRCNAIFCPMLNNFAMGMLAFCVLLYLFLYTSLLLLIYMLLCLLVCACWYIDSRLKSSIELMVLVCLFTCADLK